MRVLVNYNKWEKPHLPSLAYVLRQQGVTALSTAKDLTIGELLEQAAQTNCGAILLSNEQTLRYCVPGEAPSADKWRGSRLNFKIPTIVINKLEHIRTVPHGQWLIEKDIAKLKSIHVPAKKFGYKLLDSQAAFAVAYAELSKAFFIATDIETKTFDYKGPGEKASIAEWRNPVEAGETIISCSAWTGAYLDGTLRTYVLPLVNFGVDHWASDLDYSAALLFLKRVNALANRKVMHNGMYDATHLIRYHCPPLNWAFDTMAMAHAEYAELPKTLDFVASYQLYDYIFWKDDAESAAKSKDLEKYWAYNAKDTWYTARIAIQQLRTAPAYAFSNYAAKAKTVYPALYCNFEGLLIDQDRRLELRDKAVAKLSVAKSALQTKFADPNFNPGSWQQVEKYVYKVFGAKHPGLGKSKAGTDEMNLKSVATQHPLLARLVSDILNYREANKAVSTYYDCLQYRGRLLYALNPYGTESERMACSASSLWCGTQVQNIPLYAKPMLVADPGFELFEADNKQSEGRTTAYCSQETSLIAALENAERDFYKTLGELFFNITYENVTKEFRNKVIKRIVHGSNYMMGVDTFIGNIIKEVEEGLLILFKAAKELKIDIVETARKNRPKEMTLKQFVKFLLDSYHGPFPRIRVWYGELKDEISRTGFLVSPLGHHRRFFGDIKSNHNMLRGAVAHQPQNLSVTILDRGFNRVYHELVIPGRGDIRIKAQIHDSIFGQIRIGMRDYYAPRIIACMDNPVTVHGRTLRIPVDIKFGNNWAEYDAVTNPGGTVEWKGPTT